MSNRDNARAFRVALEAASKTEIPEAVVRVQKGIVLEVLRKGIQKSPVGNPSLWKVNAGITNRRKQRKPKGYVGGTFRGFWQVVVGTDPGDGKAPPPKRTRPRQAETAKNQELRNLKTLTLGQTAFVVNGMPYSVRLNDGWSSQAPQGWFELSVAEVANMTAEQLGDLGDFVR